MARNLASARPRTSAAGDDGPDGFAWVCGASVRRGPDITHAMLTELDLHADPDAGADHGEPPQKGRHVQRQTAERDEAAEQAAHEAVQRTLGHGMAGADAS